MADLNIDLSEEFCIFKINQFLVLNNVEISSHKAELASTEQKLNENLDSRRQLVVKIREVKKINIFCNIFFNDTRRAVRKKKLMFFYSNSFMSKKFDLNPKRT